VAGLSRPIRLTNRFVTHSDDCNHLSRPPQPLIHNGCSLTCIRFGLFPVRSPLLGESLLLSFPQGTEMFQFPWLAPLCLCVQHRVPGLHPGGFPHSGIPGSTVACTSPRLFAAYHALLRLLAPRHPPYALTNLTSSPMDPIPASFISLCSFQRTEIKFSIGSKKNSLYFNGGDERNRTADPLLARQVLSQLSYTPTLNGGPRWT
jgi:hypothetical protein